jgi:hypothetical protein
MSGIETKRERKKNIFLQIDNAVIYTHDTRATDAADCGLVTLYKYCSHDSLRTMLIAYIPSLFSSRWVHRVVPI